MVDIADPLDYDSVYQCDQCKRRTPPPEAVNSDDDDALVEQSRKAISEISFADLS